MLGRRKSNKIKSYSIILSIFLAIGPDVVFAEHNCFTASQIAGIIFVTSFTTFFAVIVIAILLWYFYRSRATDKNFIAKVESNVTKSGRVIYDERTNEMENKTVDGIISSSFTDKMTSCTSLTGKYDDNDDTDDIHVKNQKVQLKQQRQCIGSQPMTNDLSTNNPMNILENAVRCLLDKDTSALGFQISQRSDDICISYVEPNGPADRSGNIFVGDKIKELTITFENMSISDALTILSCASTYKIRLELERAIINDTIQPDCCMETTKYLDDTSSNQIQQFSLPYKSYSTSDLAQRVQKGQISDKTSNGGSFMSKQKYQLPRQTAINTIKEEVLSTTHENLSTSSPSPDFTENAEVVPIMTESIISEETIIISDESSEPPVPVVRSFQISSNEVSSESQNSSCVVSSKIKSKSNCTSNSTPTKDAISRQQLTSQISSPCNEHPILTLIPERSHKIDEIKCNGFSEFVERSHFMYSNANIKDDVEKNCAEFCELIEPKRESIVIKFEEDQEDDDYQQEIEKEMTNMSNCNGTFAEAKNDLHQINSNIINGTQMETSLNPEIIDVVHTEKDTISGNISNITDINCNTSYHPVITAEVLTDLPRRTDVIENNFNDFNTEILSSNNAEQIEDRVTSEISNHLEINDFNIKHAIEDQTSNVETPPIVPRKINNNDKSPNEISQRSPKRSQLRKLSGNCGINEAGKEVKKLNGIANDLKDEGNNRSNIPQRSPKWSPKLQSHIPIVTRTPSTKSKSKMIKIEGNKVTSNSTYLTRSKTSDDMTKNDINGASLYIAKKESLRKTHLPFSKLNKSDEGTDLAKERKARLEANQALLQRQQDELRTLGILP
ncbi:Glutamate receptor-interacting protein [Dirofilaria immitis]